MNTTASCRRRRRIVYSDKEKKRKNNTRTRRRRRFVSVVSWTVVTLTLWLLSLPSAWGQDRPSLGPPQHHQVNVTQDSTCRTIKASPGCASNPDCQDSVCATEPICCQLAWTETCVQTATALCHAEEDGRVVNSSDNCFRTNLTHPGCAGDTICQDQVCLARPQCCEDGQAWDEVCVDLAVQHCALPLSDASCLVSASSSVPGCRHETCLRAVCHLDSTCCAHAFGETCVQLAQRLPDSLGCRGDDDDEKEDDFNNPLAGTETPLHRRENHCFDTSEQPGCNDSICLAMVAQEHPFCATQEYNQTCVDSARRNAMSCLNASIELGSRNCLDASPIGGCGVEECERAVCQERPGCCRRGNLVGEWDEACLQLARGQACDLAGQNTCFQAVRTQGCTDEACAAKVCEHDDFCCERQWDASCVERAIELAASSDVCQQDWPKQDNTCFQVDPLRRPSCNDNLCEAIVCTLSPECCNISYDEQCVTLALRHCELPEPENSCFLSSGVPGCTDNQCLDKVCDIDETCCTVAYSNICVDIAKQHARYCRPPRIDNSCFEPSPFGGCNDRRCEQLVCEINEDCCNGDQAGEWNSLCVGAAKELCQPEILPRPSGGDCPYGMTCNSDFMSNCTDLAKQYREVFEIGDVYGGIFCGNPSGTIQNCPRGMYCPDPQTMLPCPAGFYCPFKTSVPTIRCRKCAEGAIELTQDAYGYVILSIILFFIFIYIAWGLLQRYNKRLADRIQYFEKRIIASKFNGKTRKAQNMEQKQMLEKLRPKLELIARRLSRLEKSNPTSKRKEPPSPGLLRRNHNAATRGHARKNSWGSSSGHTRKNSWGSSSTGQIAKGHVRKNSWGSSSTVPVKKGHARKNSGGSSSTDPVKKGHARKNSGGSSSSGHVRRNSWGASPAHVRTHSNSGNGLEFIGEDIRFDARRVFDILDVDCSGDVTFEELNVILGFNEAEMKEFIRRMNEMAGTTSNNDSVTRPVFVKYFLQALLETSNLTISYEEAEALFDEMAGGTSDKPVKEINMQKFYSSSMSDFLSDTQIYELIRAFKALKTISTAEGTALPSDRKSFRFGMTGSFLEIRKSSRILNAPPLKRPTAASLRRSITVSSVPSRRGNLTIAEDISNFREYFARRNSIVSQGSTTGHKTPAQVQSNVTREEFIENYPQLLMDIMLEKEEEDDYSAVTSPDFMGVDICFTNLSLSVKVGKQSAKVVDGVTGRIRAKTMTGILGGSGAGKTSLLNALCGRAYYGETKGTILVNGHKASIEEFKDSVGFVPQDDIVYSELTVRENLIFSGKFRLPKGTSTEEIEELADETLASLGLARVADSRVGDIRRRGVSGGERKRVSIGVELMALPSILFLDEPTSGLDASSALLVMKGLKHLVEKDGVTVVSVIHQPRKFIYDLFDSLILLGVGGRMVYTGPTENAETYFGRLNYSLPQGESVADWLIDISSGRLEPDNHVAETKRAESFLIRKQASKKTIALPPLRAVLSEDKSEAWCNASANASTDSFGFVPPIAPTRPPPIAPPSLTTNVDDHILKLLQSKPRLSRDEVWEAKSDEYDDVNAMKNDEAADEESPSSEVTETTSPLKESSDGSDQADSRSVDSEPLVRKISFDQPRTPSTDSLDFKEEIDSVESPISRRSTSRLGAAGRVVSDVNCIGAKGVTTGKVVQAMEEAKERRAWLCEEWSKYFEKLSPEDRVIYQPPEKYDLPIRIEEPSLWFQFRNQLRRALIVAWRNRFSKIIDFTVIVLAVIVITALDGVTNVSLENDPDIPYEVMVRPLQDDVPSMFEQLFSYAMTHQIQYPLKVGIILSVLLGLTATKIVTSKRLEFFREAGSGYNLNAYFWAISILSTIEHSVQVVIAAFFASWIRNPIGSNTSYYIHFLLLAWVTVSWALFIPMVFPADNVTLVAGFFFAFCGLMFSGAFAPIQYHQIYEEGGFKEVFAGWISPTRFFYEALAVGEYRCLPEQSGYTIEETSVNRQANSSMTIALGYAGHDYNAVRWSCNGWYWSVIPVLLIGFTIRYLAIGAMHAFYRGQQTKKPLLYVMRRSRRVATTALVYSIGFVGLFAITTYSFVKDQPFDDPEPPSQAELLNRFGFFE